MTTSPSGELASRFPTLHRSSLSLLDSVVAAGAGGEAYRTETLTSEFLLLVSRAARYLDFPLTKCLDVGCGTGYSLLLWAQLFEQAFGIDLPAARADAERLFAKLPASASSNITLLPATGETFDLPHTFEVITTQYVLEHVDSIPATLENLRRHLTPSGLVIHTLNGSISRSNWYMEYRASTSPLKRIAQALVRGRSVRSVVNPFGFTPPHEKRFGDFGHELNEYRLSRWAFQVFRAGFEVLDYFPTDDINWVLITRRI